MSNQSSNLQAIYPLTPMQHGLLFQSTYAEDVGAYVVQFQLMLDGTTHLETFQQTWRQLVDNHDVLRTCFVWQKGKPLQVVLKQVELSWQIEDWQHLSAESQSQQFQAWLRRDQKAGIEVTQAPLMRFTLFRLNEQKIQFVWTSHHALLDGWSMAILVQELLKRYAANCQGQDLRRVSRRPYQDYIAWYQQQDKAPAKAYWQQQLAGVSPPVPLPIQTLVLAPSASPAAEYHEQVLELSAAFMTAIQTWRQRWRFSLATLIYGAWGMLLGRYGGESDVMFGITASGRSIPLVGIEDMVGLFINTLPLRVKLSGEASLETVLKQLSHDLQDLQTYGHLPLVEIQALTEVRSRGGLFDTLVIVENYPIDESLNRQQQGMLLETMTVREQTHYPLTLSVFVKDGLSLKLSYNSDLFEADAITRMLGHLQTLLEGMVANFEKPLLALPLLTPVERQQLLVSWNDTQVNYAHDQCMHQLFEAQAKQTPEAIAVSFEDQHLTYQALNDRANQLAHYLQTLGVGPDILVGICVERSLDMLIGLLGILKAGGAYVPLDPAYPSERLSFMLDNAQVSVLLTQAHLQESLPQHSSQLVCLDTDWETIAQHSSCNLEPVATADNLAYIIYTSGSTGNPKGVMIEHRSLTNFLQSVQHSPGLTATDTLLAVTTISFDIAALELYLPLIVGAKVVVASREVATDATQLWAAIRQSATTVMQATPATWRALLTIGWPAACTLKILCGGEALSPDLAELLLATGSELWNMYGPTETTIWSALKQIDAGTSPILIGRPLANTQCYVLDEQQQPVPVGVTGELYIGGHGLARGYLNQPALTAEKFIALDIPSGESGQLAQRAYRTGDLACYLPNGELRVLGRRDDQVKIRGFRIELGEIESAIAQHPAIQSAAVVVRDITLGDSRLIAYVVFKPTAMPEQPLTSGELRQFLQQKLPDYMLPSVFVTLDALPLTPNGKVDRRALPAPDASESEGSNAFVAPRSITEQQLADIWSDILKVEQVGIHDSFFDLGGHSLIATQLVARLRDAFEVNLSLRTLFDSPTVAGIGDAIASAKKQVDSPPESMAQAPATSPFSLITENQRQHLAADVEDAYPLTQLQLGMVFHNRYKPKTGLYHNIFSYRLNAPLTIDLLRSAVEVVTARHPVLRTSLHLSEFGDPLQCVHKQVTLQFAVDDLPALSTAERTAAIAAWIEQEKQRPFDDQQAPLIRFQVHQWEPASFNLTLSFNHAVLDGWSGTMLITELCQQYLNLLGEPVEPLQPVPAFTFRDFIAQEQALLNSEPAQQYWQKTLANFTATRLPRWTTQGEPSPSATVSNHPIELAPPLSRALHAFAQTAGVSLKSVLLTAHLKVMGVLSNQTDVTTGVVSHGRPAVAGSDRILGLFLNTIPMRLQLASSSWTALVQQMLNQEKEVSPFQAYPLSDLQRTVGQGQSLFEVVFNYVSFDVFQHIAETNSLAIEGDQLFEKTNFPLVVQAIAQPGVHQLALNLQYDPNTFSDDQISAMAQYYQLVLTTMVTQPTANHQQLCLLTPAERQQQLVTWNQTQTAYAKDQCMHQLFEAQVERTPDEVAAVFAGEQLTYRELNERANQLAHHLQTLGVKAETLVGICVERSLDMLVSLLAILKAGGAYVPLDPSYPSARLSFMLTDAQVKVLLTRAELLATLPDTEAHPVCLDTDASVIAGHARDNLATVIAPDQLAYIIYTSGSTGNPKGVMIEHHSLTNFLQAMQQAPGLSGDDTLLAVTTVSFDIAALELYLPLLVGAKVVIASREIAMDARQLSALINRSEVSVMQATPATWRSLLTEPWPRPLKVLCGGEALPLDLAQQLLATKSTLWNLYGPTETTIWSAAKQIISTHPPISIGHPIANTQLYLLDPYDQPVPIGVSGELHIGGAGLARGYLNRPDLTLEKFVLPTVSSLPSRLYKTGDLARYLPNGEIEILGRADYQVKLRGFRIELGEIETLLVQHASVHQAVVMVREDTPGNQQLVAYVKPAEVMIANPQNNISATDVSQTLRRHLQQSLPDYMVPGLFVSLETFPLTPNGKVDRRALPAPEIRLEAADTFVAPQDEIDLRLTKIWERIFGFQPIGLTDNFFELGGHSLLAVRLFADIEKAFGKRIPLARLFEQPTIEQLATLLREEEVEHQWSALVPMQSQGDQPPFICIHSGYGEILVYQNLAFRLGIDRPIYGLQATGLDEQALSQAEIVSLATQYIKEVKTIQPEGPYFLGGLCVGGVIALEMAQQLKTQGEDVPLIAVFGISPVSLFTSAERMSHAADQAADQATDVEPESSRSTRLAKWLYWTAARVRSPFQLKPLLYQLYQRTGKPLSQDLQRFHTYQNMVRSVWQRAQTRTESMRFDGHLLVFWANKDRRFSAVDQRRWADIAPGKAEVYSLPEAHIAQALKGTCAQSITEIVRQRLAEVQSKAAEPILAKSGGIQHVFPASEMGIASKAQVSKAQASKAQVSEAWTSLVAIKPTGCKPPLFCIHDDAGTNPGEPLYGYDIARYISPEQPIYGLRAVGLDGSTPPLRTIEAMATRYLSEIRALTPSGPYLLLGVGAGALIALEIAQQLSRLNQPAAKVIVIDVPLRTAIAQAHPPNRLVLQNIKKELQCRSIVRAIKQHPLPNDLRYFKIKQSFRRAQKAYQPAPYGHPLTLFCQNEGLSHEGSSAASNTAAHQPASWLTDWQALAPKTLEIRSIAGTRSSVFKAPHSQPLAKAIEDAIDIP